MSLSQVILDAEFDFLLNPSYYRIPNPTRFKSTAVKYIVDAGANCGLVSIFFANLYPDATIISVEAHPGNFLALKRNAAAYPNIQPIKAAVWDAVVLVDVSASMNLRVDGRTVFEDALERVPEIAASMPASSRLAFCTTSVPTPSPVKISSRTACWRRPSMMWVFPTPA